MVNAGKLARAQPEGADALAREDGAPLLALGRWVLVSDKDKRWNAEKKDYDIHPYEWLGCISHIGSNYVSVSAPPQPGSSPGSTRIHFDKVFETLRFQSDAEAEEVIQGNILKHKQESVRLLGEIQDLTMRLGLKTAGALGDRSAAAGTALVALSGQVDPNECKSALIKAEKETLPELFKAMKETTKELGRWMTAGTLPLLAAAGDPSDYVGGIKDRIFTLSLYAGLVETVTQCREGAPADFGEKLRVMQRRCYMDEECLANYRAGGMSINEIGKFDAWLSDPENFERILPFPRCIVAFRVRRNDADREWDGSLMGAYINIHLAAADKATFLYIRNGEQLWRLSTEIDFGHLIFPDKVVYDPGEPMMVKRFAGSIEKMMSLREYEDCIAERERNKASRDQWLAENPFEQWLTENPGKEEGEWKFANPYRDWEYSSKIRMHDHWEPFDQSSLYFDDAMAHIEKQVKEHNRIATIIQGLFDRSEVLHPHPPVQTWTPTGFAAAIELVFDGTMVLHDGEAPDFEAYRARCNASIGVGSLVTGQDIFWMEREAEKEMKRRERDWRMSENERYRKLKRFTPYGNPGPGIIAKVEEWKPRSRTATFRWERKRLKRDPWETGNIPCSISIPDSELFNVSAYRPGDFKQFYRDSRTRAQYLKWAPLLLAAEEWWAKQEKEEGRNAAR